MSILSGVNNFFGLDIGTTAVRLVELTGTGSVKTLSKYAYAPLDSKISMSDSKADQQKVAQIIRDLIAQSRVSSKNVAVGIPSSRVFTTVIDFERLSSAELGKSILLQADSLIPTPLAESKLDWALLGDSPVDKTKVEIMVSSVANSFVESRLGYAALLHGLASMDKTLVNLIHNGTITYEEARNVAVDIEELDRLMRS